MGNQRLKRKQQLEELVAELQRHSSVVSASYTHFFVRVVFATGITENWALNDEAHKKRKRYVYRLPETGPYFKDPINTYSQFETNPLNSDHDLLKDHFIVKRKDLRKAGWCDVRCKIHELTLELYNQGWRDIAYPDSVLRQDYDDLKNSSFEKHQTSLIRYSAFDGRASGRRLILNFIPTLAKDYWEIYPIYHRFNKEVSGWWDLTRERLVYDLSLRYHTVRFPGFFRSIFNQWYPISGKNVLDLHPDLGYKALGVVVDGGNYYHVSDQKEALARLGEFTTSIIAPHEEGNHYDLAMISDVHPITLKEVDERINKYSSIADNLMVTISQADRQTAIDRYKPWRILRVKDIQGEKATKDNYILIIGQR